MARRFARAVYLSTTDGQGSFSDNFFDLLPGESTVVKWKGPVGGAPVDAAHLSAMLRMMTVRDTY